MRGASRLAIRASYRGSFRPPGCRPEPGSAARAHEWAHSVRSWPYGATPIPMEAATPLRPPHVRTIGDRLVVESLVVEDTCAVRLVRERESTGDDPVKVVRDAVEIGARVLDREQAAANAEFVKTEFEKASRDVQVEFADRARTIAEFFEKQFTAVFGEDDGQLAKELERRFGDGSSVSVQNRVRELVAETLSKSREDLVRQFSAADDRNPLADFKASTIRELRAAGERQQRAEHVLLERLAQLETQLQ